MRPNRTQPALPTQRREQVAGAIALVALRCVLMGVAGLALVTISSVAWRAMAG